MECEEGLITIECEVMEKSVDKYPFLMCGFQVENGFGKMFVVGVRVNREFGIVKQEVQTVTEYRPQTPLQEKLDNKLYWKRCSRPFPL
jgi:hypothetical protein